MYRLAVACCYTRAGGDLSQLRPSLNLDRSTWCSFCSSCSHFSSAVLSPVYGSLPLLDPVASCHTRANCSRSASKSSLTYSSRVRQRFHCPFPIFNQCHHSVIASSRCLKWQNVVFSLLNHEMRSERLVFVSKQILQSNH